MSNEIAELAKKAADNLSDDNINVSDDNINLSSDNINTKSVVDDPNLTDHREKRRQLKDRLENDEEFRKKYEEAEKERFGDRPITVRMDELPVEALNALDDLNEDIGTEEEKEKEEDGDPVFDINESGDSKYIFNFHNCTITFNNK